MKTTFPLRDDKGKIRQVTLQELQLSNSYAAYREPDSITRTLTPLRSTVSEDILSGDLKFPVAVLVVRDEEYNPVVYASYDDKTAFLVYYKG